MFKKIQRWKKYKNMNNATLSSHSVVMVDRRISGLPEGQAVDLTLVLPLPFDEFANPIIISQCLRDSNANEIATPYLDGNAFSKKYMSPSFTFQLEPLRFMVLQRNSENRRLEQNNLLCSSLLRTLVTYPNNSVQNIGAIGVNYEYTLNIDEASYLTLLSRLLVVSMVSSHRLVGGAFKASFQHSTLTDCIITVDILKRNNVPCIAFNANNLISAGTTLNSIQSILQNNFYEDCRSIGGQLLNASSGQ